ncbi:MAG TPA: hypothetical protein VFU88_09270 [Ktedonobacterales bacterium]|nr:hypothetical protein [Ktedonobacterales bacterium]
MTEAEAIAILNEQYDSESGFLAKLERGEGLDQEAVSRVRAAFAILQEAWADRTDVPKTALYPLIDSGGRIRAAAAVNQAQHDELVRLSMELAGEVEQLVTVAPRPTEEWAIAEVVGHLSGLPSLALTLHHREHVNRGFVEDLQRALDVLAEAWRGRKAIPRLVAGLMLEAPALFRDHAGNYREQERYALNRARLEAVGEDMAARVRRCLLPNEVG